MAREYFNEKTMCYEYPNGELKETFEQRLDRELLEDKWRAINAEGKSDIVKLIKEFDNLNLCQNKNK